MQKETEGFKVNAAKATVSSSFSTLEIMDDDKLREMLAVSFKKVFLRARDQLELQIGTVYASNF